MTGTKRRLRIVAAVAAIAPWAPKAPAQAPRVLFLTHSAGYQHAVVKRMPKDHLAYAELRLQRMAKGEIEVDATQDCGAITAENLAGYDAVAFYTTGELPISDAGRQALLSFVERGGGFVGIHCATDTLYQYPAYGKMIGGYFDGHPWHQKVQLRVEGPHDHPATALLAPSWEITDEIYQFRSWSRDDVQVLLSLDPESVDITKGKRDDGDYALSWCKSFGKGRVFYTALGHRFQVWQDRRFQQHLMGGLRWALGERAMGRPPAGATVLFDGHGTEHWRSARGGDIGWKTDGDVMQVVPGSGSIVTREPYGDFRLHVEFRLPDSPPGARGQGRGNSGVYLQRRYEVQILDSHDGPPRIDGCAALYRRRAPDVNVCRPPHVWQSYDIRFRAPRWDEAGHKTENARLTLVYNGVMVHDDVEVEGKTGAGRPEGIGPGPILLQDHGHAVQFRRIWIQPLP